MTKKHLQYKILPNDLSTSFSQKDQNFIYVFLNIRDWCYTLISLAEKAQEDMIQHKI